MSRPDPVDEAIDRMHELAAELDLVVNSVSYDPDSGVRWMVEVKPGGWRVLIKTASYPGLSPYVGTTDEVLAYLLGFKHGEEARAVADGY